jgi:hypothetical protein
MSYAVFLLYHILLLQPLAISTGNQCQLTASVYYFSVNERLDK